MTPAMEGTIRWIIASVLFFYLPSISTIARFKGVLQTLSLPFFFAGWLGIANGIDRAILVPAGLDALLYPFPCCLMLFGLSLFVGRDTGRIYRAISSYTLLPVFFGSFVLGATMTTTLVAVLIGAVLMAEAFSVEEKHPFVGGVLCVAMGLGYHILASISFWMRSPWISLGSLGVMILLAAVYLEKNEAVISRRWRAACARFGEWN
jgi:hypothetical protein